MIFAVEAWTIPDGEETCELEMASSAEFPSEIEAQALAWERLEEGFAVRLWRR